jgi:23S rRNA pseudouridine1911/1915/1917 synthase
VNEFNITLTPDHPAKGDRLDKFLHSTYPHLTRSYIQNLIINKMIRVNGDPVKCGYKLKGADRIRIQLNPIPATDDMPAENIPLQIIHEDDHVLVIDKPAGLVVHPGAGNHSGTLVNGLLYHCRNLSSINGKMRPGIVHRLDKNTSGLLVVAKNDRAHLHLARQFESRDISRTYQAVVWGTFAVASGEIETLIDRSRKDRTRMTVARKKGRWALTTYRVIKSFPYFSYLELVLKTGRTHQIRVHLDHIHHPVCGDPEYNGRLGQLSRLPAAYKDMGHELLKKIDRQALHACKLSFIHPQTTKRMQFESPLPADMRQLLEMLATL